MPRRTPVHTRSVSLLGSWDNFSKPYAMQRDARRSKEHWTGCHNFENIICDGNVSAAGHVRDGGLKMGGTYWYYVSRRHLKDTDLQLINIYPKYQLDNSIEFHNSAEPSTTSCPLLPGQLVNVLHVPFHLSNGRSRNDSVSSTSSELRTMNPEDKFLNPRPVPARPPKLARLNTSPTLSQHPNQSDSSTWSGSPWSARSLSSSRGASPSNSAAALRMFRLPRRPSVDGRSRSTSPPNKTSGLKAAFRQLTTPRPVSPEGGVSGSRIDQFIGELEISEPLSLNRTTSGRISKASSNSSSKKVSREHSPASSLDRQPIPLQTSHLALRRGLEQPPDLQDGIPASSFQSHRRQRSRSRDPSCLRNSLTVPDDCIPEALLNDGTGHRYQALETLKEAPSQQNTPTWPTTAMKVEISDTPRALPDTILEKRLPTLPSSPSSAYPSSAASDSPAKRLSEELQNLKSHFSEMTASSASNSCLVEKDYSHFSQWTATTIECSPSSDYCIDAIGFSSREPSLSRRSSFPYKVHSVSSEAKSALAREDTFMSEAELLPSTISCSTISSCDSTSPPSPSYQALDPPFSGIDHSTSSEKRFGMTADGRLPGFVLPEGLQTSDVRLKIYKSPVFEDQADPTTPRVGIKRPDSIAQMPNHQGFSHSASMQQLMDELSYLGEMIQK